MTVATDPVENVDRPTLRIPASLELTTEREALAVHAALVVRRIQLEQDARRARSLEVGAALHAEAIVVEDVTTRLSQAIGLRR